LSWRSTFVYGEPKAQDRPEIWKLLRRIKKDVKEPWVMLGDFNEAMWQHEHLSITKRNERKMENFREVLSDCNLHDLGFTGLPWTYNNKKEGIMSGCGWIEQLLARVGLMPFLTLNSSI
jgi:hypothetical protein